MKKFGASRARARERGAEGERERERPEGSLRKRKFALVDLECARNRGGSAGARASARADKSEKFKET